MESMSPESAFLQFWQTDRTRDALFSLMSKTDLGSLRQVCRNFGARTAIPLFEEVTVVFRASTFTQQSRVAALGRIGHLVKRLHFFMPHSSEAFLPPLVNTENGEEVTFVYEPSTQVARYHMSRLSIPTYGSWEMTDLLVRQYPPLFHAAANVSSFVRAFSLLNNLSHLEISCPGQEPGQRYRRSIVDYALISLRLAIERNILSSLDTLSLSDIHPAALLYLNPQSGFGALPNSLRKWRQIRRLYIRMDSVSPASSLPDHLKHLHSYLRIFSTCLRHFDFQWQGERCPCPLTINAEEPVKASSPSHACPLTCRSVSKPIRFVRLRSLRVENTIAEACHIARFISRHHRAVRHTKRLKLKFDNTILREGTWDEALEPLTLMSGSDSWKSSSEESRAEPVEESMEVPIMFSPVDLQREQLNKMWDDNVRSRSSRPYYSRIYNLQKAGKEILFGTEEHMRKLFNSTVFGWR